MLFGAAEEDPQVDLFGSSSPLTPSDESKPFPPIAKKPQLKQEARSEPPKEAKGKEKVEVKGATTSATSTDVPSGQASSDVTPRDKVSVFTVSTFSVGKVTMNTSIDLFV